MTELRHQAIRGPVFRLLEGFELDVALGDDEQFTVRIELLRSEADPELYRCRVWRSEHFRIQPTFPQDAGAPAHTPCDESLLVEDPSLLRASWDPDRFRAESPEQALARIQEALLAFLEHATGSARA